MVGVPLPALWACVPFSGSIPNAVELDQFLCQRIASERMPAPMLQLGKALKIERVVVESVLVLVVNVVAFWDGAEIVFPDVTMEKPAPWFGRVEVSSMLSVLAVRIAPITLSAIFQNVSLA